MLDGQLIPVLIQNGGDDNAIGFSYMDEEENLTQLNVSLGTANSIQHHFNSLIDDSSDTIPGNLSIN